MRDPYTPLTSHIHLGELKDTENIYYLSSRFCPMSYFLLSGISQSSGVQHGFFPSNFSYQCFRDYLEKKVEERDKIRVPVHKIGSHW